MSAQEIPATVGDDAVMARIRHESSAVLDDCFRPGCGHTPTGGMPPMAPIGEETRPGPVHVERRRLPRPKPEHVLGLAKDLTDARALLESGSALDHAGAVATIALVENSLRNLAGALGGGRS